MALFNRKKKDSVLPEVDKYYKAEKRDRPGLAWLLALVSIAVVAGLIVAVFLGGRWAYNQITGDDDTNQVAVDEETDAPSFDGGSEDTDENDTTFPDSDEEPASPDEADGDETAAPAEGRDDTEVEPVNPSGSASTLPNTGPGDVAAVFAGVSLLAGGTHYAVQRRKLSR